MTKDHDITLARRIGRPRREEAGDVEARILIAATGLFLERGVAATSCEAVAAQAGVGKASLYSRYSGKDALFEAVVKKAVDDTAFVPALSDLAPGSLRSRLAIVGKAVLVHALSPVPLEMMRLFLTEARRSPDLIAQVDGMARSQVVDIIAGSIGDGESAEQAQARLRDVVERFLDLTFAPLILAGLSGHRANTSAESVNKKVEIALTILEGAGLLEALVSNT